MWSEPNSQELAKYQKNILLGKFYRPKRKQSNILIVDNQPIGGRWNFAKPNRPLPKGKFQIPETICFQADNLITDVIN